MEEERDSNVELEGQAQETRPSITPPEQSSSGRSQPGNTGIASVLDWCQTKAITGWKWSLANPRDILFWTIFLSLAIFTILPLWIINYLPLSDLPNHAGQIQIILNYENYKDDYSLNWFTPYLVAYGLTVILAQVFPVVIAIKIVLSFTMLAFPIGAFLLNRQLGGNRYWALICFPASFSFSFFWGFFSYVVGSALVVYFFVFVLAYARRNITYTWYFIAFLLSLFLFYAHLIAWAFAISAAPLILFIFNNFRETLKKTSAFFLVFPLAALWMYVSEDARVEGTTTIPEGHYISHAYERVTREISYVVEMFQMRSEKDEHSMRAKELLGLSIGRPGFPDYVAFACCLLLWPLFCGAKLTMNVRRWLPLLYCVSCFMLAPYFILKVAYVYYRFAVFLLPLALFIYIQRDIDKESEENKRFNWYNLFYHTAGVLFIAFILRGNYTLFASFKENDQSFSAVMDKMLPGKTVQTLVFETSSRFKYSPPYLHFGVWYQAEKGGVVSANFSHAPDAYGIPVRYKHNIWKQASPWQAAEFNWREHSGHLYDYFLVRSNTRRDGLFRESKDIILLEQNGKWLLYGRRSLNITPTDSGS